MDRRRILSKPWHLSITSHSNLTRRYHLSTTLLQPIPSAAASPAPQTQQQPSPRSASIPAPDKNTGPLLARQPNRQLPTLENPRRWLKTLPLFIAAITVSALAIFNYQKSSSSTVNSILYALRTNETAKRVLGDEVYFASKVPWIAGELNQLHGRIDISFWVKGSRGKGRVRFVSVRTRRSGFFETLEWTLKPDDGKVIDLLDSADGYDPFQKPTNE